MIADVTQELRDTENAIRDFVASLLATKLGSDWVQQCGVTPDRLEKWLKRREDEARRQEAGVIEERLIYYADFYDLKTILKKQWTFFSDALGDWKTMEVFLTELERLRDPDAHRRELLPHQKHLVLGIGGEIRTRLVRFRSKNETAEDFFPRLESARDSLGNIWVPAGELLDAMRLVSSKQVLRVGDKIDYVITASDPMGEPLQYAVNEGEGYRSENWSDDGTLSVTVTERDIGKLFVVDIWIRSRRKYHAYDSIDDKVHFSYAAVLPAR